MEKISKTEEEWRAQLNEEEFWLLVRRERNARSRGFTGTPRLQAFTTVSAAICRFLTQERNSTQVVGGRAFSRLSMKRMFEPEKM